MFKKTNEYLKKAIRSLIVSPVVTYAVSPQEVSMATTYNSISTLARCVDLLIDSAANIPLNVFEFNGSYYKTIDKPPKWAKLLTAPSPTVDTLDFYKGIYKQLIFTGTCLIYDTGAELEIIPSYTFNPGANTFVISGKTYPNDSAFALINLLHSKNSPLAVPYISRVSSEVSLINTMLKFEKSYYKNNGFPGIILKTERPLSTKLKERILTEYSDFTSIIRGKAGAPYILDSGMEVQELQKNFKDLEFRESLKDVETKIISNLGIPPLLLNSGNNANITPNIKLFYTTTILPLVNSVASVLTLHSRQAYKSIYVVRPDISTVSALKADFISESNAIKSIYAVGLISRNEARAKLQFSKLDEEPHFLEPANIAGSAVDPNSGKE